MATQRSGSSWLVDLMGSHPRIRMFEEVFLDRPANPKPYAPHLQPAIRYYEFLQQRGIRRPRAAWEYLSGLNREVDGVSAFGFKLMYDQLRALPEIWPKLILDRYRLVHLVRKNLMDVLVSREMMRQRGRKHTTEAEVDSGSVYIDPASVEARLAQLETGVSKARRLLAVSPIRHIEVTYEQLVDDAATALSRIMKLLSFSDDCVNWASRFRKVNPGERKELIANYDDICRELEGTRFSRLLH